MLPDGTINPGEMTSFNHYALGAVSAFLHNHVAGLAPISPGWKHFLVQPKPGGTVTWAKASHISPYGKIECQWTLKDGILCVQIEVPPNSTARVVLPGVDLKIGSGIRKYEVEWKTDPKWPPKVPQKPLTPVKVDEVVE